MPLPAVDLRLPKVPFGTPGPRASIVIPTCNEAKNLPHVFSRLPDGMHEVIVVDGRSVDGTVGGAGELRREARTVRQTRCGKGTVLPGGSRAAPGAVSVMLAAAGPADPREIPRYVA